VFIAGTLEPCIILPTMQLHNWELVGIMLLCAELLLILARSSQLQALAKPENQRTTSERLDIKRGMGRSILLEAAIFVPTSVVLVYITVRPILLLNETLRVTTALNQSLALAFYGSLGLTSYGFPFGAMKKIVTRIAMSTLKEFTAIAHSATEGDQGPETQRSTVA
jgi:hypothetical protein